MFDIILELDRNTNAKPIALRHRRGEFAFFAVDAYSLDPSLAIAIAMIDIRNMVKEPRNSSERLSAQFKVRRYRERLPQCFFFHDFFSSASYHRGKIFRNHVICFSLQMNLAVIHPNCAIGETSHGLEVMRDE